MLPVENGYINAATGDLHLEIPLGSFPQRGGRQFKAMLMYDSNIWGSGEPYPLNIPMSGGPPDSVPGSMGGWRLVTSVISGYSYDQTDSNSVCSTDGQSLYTFYEDWIWYGPDGTAHAFPVLTKYFWPSACNNYNPPVGIPTGGAYALDATGYYMSVTNYTTATVYAPDGTIMTGVPCAQGNGSCLANKVEDANGNKYSTDNNYANLPFASSYYHISSGNPIDTLGRTLVKTTVSGSNTIYFDVLNSQGGTSRYTVTTETVNENNGYPYPISFPAIQSIALPNGTSYSFQYDSGTTLGHLGLLTSMTLPTGGQVSYSFAWFVLPFGTGAGLQISSRTTPDSATPWSYTYYNVPNTCQQNPAGFYQNCQFQTTVTKPSGDHSVYTFVVNGGAWPIEAQHYDASSNLLATITQTFDMSHACPSRYFPCEWYSSIYVTKTAATTTLPVPGGTNVNQTTEYTWDTTHFGNITQKSDWNFYTGTLPTTADRTTAYTYLNGSSYISANILNRAASVTVTNSSGGTVAQTVNCYDYAGGCGGTSFASATGITNHDDTKYPVSNTVRGDLTQVKKLISGSNYLTTSVTYDMTGQVLTSTDSAGNQTSYSYADNFYNDNGNSTNPVSYTPPAPTNAYVKTITQGSLVTTFGYYFGTGQKALSTDPNSQTTYFHFYDSMNRPTSTKLPNLYNGTCCGWTYAVYPSAWETQVDTGIGITSTTLSISCTGSLGDCRHDQTQLDHLGRVSSQILVSDPDGATTVATTYDSDGRVYSVTNPHRSSSLPTDGTEYYAYDGLDRQKKITRTDSSIAYMTYGALIGSNCRTSELCSGFGVGYPILYQDEAGKVRQTWTDGFGRLIETDEPDPSTGSLTSGSPAGTCYRYDLNNNLIGVTQGSETRSFSYDMLSRLTAATNPESGTTNYYYTTSSGSLCSGVESAVCRRTDARGVTRTYAYDSLTRLVSKTYTDSTPQVTYGYDAATPSGCTPPTLTITNGKGRRTSMCDGAGATSWSYDPMGNILVEERTTNSVTDSFTYIYNLDSSVWKLQYPSGRTITYQPGGAQRSLSAKDVTNSINYVTGPITPNYIVGYAPQGAIQSLQDGSSLVSTLYYNNRLQPCRISETNSGTTPTQCADSTHIGNVLDLTYGFNDGTTDNGNVLRIANNITGSTGQSVTYTFDWLNRIASAYTDATSGSGCWGETYSIDRYGNLKTIAAMTGYTGCVQESGIGVTVNSSNQITGPGTFTYDLAGNLTGEPSPSCLTSISYDAENHMTSACGVTYHYDGDGRRVQKSSGTLYWYGTSSDPLLETGSSGNLLNEYIFFSGKRTARRDSSGNIEYYVADYLGSARAVTNSSGTISESCNYYPYGGSNCSPSSVNNYLFTGKERDNESGLDNFGARDDSSQFGRFMSPDPAGLNAVHPENPQTWNLYAYAMNNPLRYTDPTGMYSCADDMPGKPDCSSKDDQAFESARIQASISGDPLVVLAAYAYGGQGVDNGVSISFAGSLPGGEAGTTVTSLGSDSQGNFRANESVTFVKGQGSDMLEQTVAHEGLHVSDAQAFVSTMRFLPPNDLLRLLNPSGVTYTLVLNPTKYWTELRAYLNTAAVARDQNETISLGGNRIRPNDPIASKINAINQFLRDNQNYRVTPENPGPRMFPQFNTDRQ